MRRSISFLLLALLLALSSGAAVLAALGAAQGDDTLRDPRGGKSSLADPTSPLTPTTTIFMPFVGKNYDPKSIDILPFMAGDDHIYEVKLTIGDDEYQARHQTQAAGHIFYHTKGNQFSAEWEELWHADGYIYRGTDTSPGNGKYYTLRDPGMYGSKWAPRYWQVGDIYFRNPHVQFYYKDNCMPVAGEGGTFPSRLLFEAFYPSYTFESGITLANVVQLAWLPATSNNVLERYFYAEGYGLVGWRSNSGARSYVSEIHAPGARPDNVREEISCLDRSALILPQFRVPLLDWPAEYRR